MNQNSNADSPVIELEEDTAWGYLDSVEVGRLATAVDSQPSIFPVNFVVDGTSVVFRTAAGTKLAEVVLNQHVAFEADGWDNDNGWSVVIRGTAERITDADELARADKMPLRPWTGDAKAHYVRITPGVITARYFRFS
ncbi:pyridoxamine 5'-phosphate oxidase family protein [Propionibacteriaceae bacterium Y1923]|uniref:pyridoxamine 5'-phosphate oxidase family protein n=1 Tax=Aestuariimicrobium sp. Y1814 TaxID=3418742 RepID=UPI003C298681